jgi:hypothetical protein
LNNFLKGWVYDSACLNFKIILNIPWNNYVLEKVHINIKHLKASIPGLALPKAIPSCAVFA